MGWESFIANGRRERAMLHGVTPDLAGIKNRKLDYGRFIADTDVDAKSPVIAHLNSKTTTPTHGEV